MASGSDPPFFHSALDRPTDRPRESLMTTAATPLTRALRPNNSDNIDDEMCRHGKDTPFLSDEPSLCVCRCRCETGGWKACLWWWIWGCGIQLFLLPRHVLSGISLYHDDPDTLVPVSNMKDLSFHCIRMSVVNFLLSRTLFGQRSSK